MKKLSLLKKLSLSLGTVAAVTPVVFMSTSCSKAITGISTDFISFANFESYSSYEKMESSHCTKEEIVLGSEKFCNGNYFLIVGSNTFDTSKILYTNTDWAADREQWFDASLGYLQSSPLYRTLFRLRMDVQKDDKKKLTTDFGIVNFIDFFDHKVYASDGTLLHVTSDAGKGRIGEETVFSPFKKWTDAYITQTKTLNREQYGYEWDETTVSTSDYIRNDDSAVAYRTLCEYGKKMFPTNDKRKETFDVADNSVKTCVFLYKDGKLVEVFDAPQSYSETSDNKITEMVKKYFAEDVTK